MITTELHRSLDAIDALLPDWERLFAARRYDPSLSPEWCRAMLRNHLAGSDDWFIIVAREAGQVRAIIPMMFVRAQVLGRTVTTLQPVQQLSGTHGDLLVVDSSPALLEACVGCLRDLSWDMVRVSRVLESDPLVGSLQAALSAVYGCHVRPAPPSYHLRFPSTYAEYLAARSGKFRNYLKRAEKKVAALGALSFERVQPTHDADQVFAEVLAIERSSWKHEHGTAISAVAHQEGFYGDLVRVALPAGWLHLTFLRVSGVAVAYNLGVVHDGCYSYLKTSFREAHRAHGVASVARALLIQSLIREQVRAFDFAGEPYEWEQQWTEEVRWHSSLVAYNRTAMGQALRLLGAVRQRLAPSATRDRIAFDDPRALRATSGSRDSRRE